GVEEYVNNEKYELRSWDINRQDSLMPLIARINRIRKSNPALQHNEIAFHAADNPLLLCYSKQAPEGDNVVLVVANMDVHNPQAGWVELDLAALGLPLAGAGDQPLQLHDLLTDARYFAQGRRLFVRLEPHSAPAHIFRLR